MHPKLDDDFDLRARAELSLAYETGEAPVTLFRHTPWFSRRWVQSCCVLAFVAGALLGGVLAVRPHELVRGAIEHEYYERTLRGSFMDSDKLLAQLGLEKDAPPRPAALRDLACGPLRKRSRKRSPSRRACP